MHLGYKRSQSRTPASPIINHPGPGRSQQPAGKGRVSTAPTGAAGAALTSPWGGSSLPDHPPLGGPVEVASPARTALSSRKVTQSRTREALPVSGTAGLHLTGVCAWRYRSLHLFTMQHKAFWSALEYTCRLLGISTAAVLIGVGVETLQQGQFKSLAFYLLFSGAAVAVCEGFFFISLFLEMCFTHKPESLAQACWKRARRPGSFQKFLGYTLLSVACFLHPVLVWHVTIPGEKLGWGVVQMEMEHAPTIIGDTEQTYTFHGAQREQHRSLLGHMKSILKGSKDRSSAPETPVLPAAMPVPRKQVHFQEKVVQIIPSVSENLEDVESEAEETTSDTTPILTPPDAPIIVAPLSPAGLF
ncbi:hypothetical protein Nmel_010446 [Mimus melanotis]